MGAAVPRPAAMVRLLAGRGAFRAGTQVAAAAPATVWDGPAFGHYAAALGLCAWLLLVADAPEKAALKTLARVSRIGPAVARLTLVMAAAPVLVLLAVLVPVAVTAPLSAATLYLAAGAWSACTGLLMAVSGLHRVRGRPALDSTAFGASGGVVLAVTAATLWIGWPPQAHLLLVLAGMVAVTCAALAALPRDWLRPPPSPAAVGGAGGGGGAVGGGVGGGVGGEGGRRRLLRPMVRATWLLGVADLCDTLCFAVVYLVLAVSGRTDQSGVLYLALLPAVAVCQLAIYLLRVAQPATSRRLRGPGGRAGRARAVRLLRRAERAGAAVAAVLACAAPLAWTRADDGVPVAVLGALVGVVLVLFLTVMYAAYLVENTNNDVLAVTSAGAFAGLVATVLLGVAVVPWLGAAGGVAALALAVPVKAHVMRRMLISRNSE
ncbi:hypothetical protein ACFFV7_30960 [Nonomuraea spiralis]|uniref:Integral membrane protein n=1 Tax=Nonomuraea spiralis TaxID=46182 RepID=A0ABV5IMB8_9ACTN|nr:hypothetical protein [Nonomuraea spiralis]GGT01184.1 hypothetical protein GCM10010176_051560 [Nonomuraea spiralis]